MSRSIGSTVCRRWSVVTEAAGEQLAAALHAEVAVQRLDVAVNRVRRQAKLVGQLLLAAPSGQAAQRLAQPRREPAQERRRDVRGRLVQEPALAMKQIPATTSVLTMVGGKIVWHAGVQKLTSCKN
jgi:hypothetical protein